jgi:glycosyltransferase involved in cell wall biosynthesis
MKVSVIIPTYNGGHKIGNLLKSLEKQSFNTFETIVIIDGSTDGTADSLKNKKYNFTDIKIIEQTNQGRAKARNNGVKIAKGDLLIFFDDDILLEKNCVELHINHHQKHKNSILFGVARMNKFIDINNDFYKYRFYIEENWNLPFRNKLTKISLDNYAFTSQCLSLSKFIFDQLDGFDERLNDSEDFDFSMKAFIANIPIYFDYTNWTWHCDYITIRAYIKRQKEYLRSKQKLALLKPQYLKMHPASFSRGTVGKVKKMIMKVFVFNAFWEMVTNSKLFLFFIPQNSRFKLYNIIIFSSSNN